LRSLPAAYEKEKRESDQNAGCNDQHVPLLILMHGSHHKKLNQNHWNSHQSSHVKLVEIVVHIPDRVDHCVHQYVHGYKREDRHNQEMTIMLPAHI
jgi:hypothetical protein